MKPAPFEYARPDSLQEAASLLFGRSDAAALSGGQSLMPALSLRERRDGLLVDISRLAELRGVSMSGGTLHIGAAEPMWDLEREPLVGEHAPLLAAALPTVGAPSIRTRATLGGSAAWADPTSQLPATLLAHAVRFVTTRRQMTADELLGPGDGRPGAGRLARGEIIVRLDIPRSAAPAALRMVRRSHITWPVAGAAVLACDTHVRVGLFGAGPTAILGSGADGSEALDAALRASDPLDDRRAGASYRRSVLPVLARRALSAAGCA